MAVRVDVAVGILGAFLVLPLSPDWAGGASVKNATPDEPFFKFDNNAEDAAYRVVTSMALSPKGDFLVMTSGDLYAFDVSTRKKIYQIPKKGRRFGIVIFGKDNDRFACFCDDVGLQIRDVKTGRVLRTVADVKAYFEVYFQDNGTFLVALERRDPTFVTIWDWTEPKPRLKIRRDPPADPDQHESYPIAFSPDGRVVATGGNQCPFDTWDIATGKRLRRFTGPNPQITRLTFSPDGKTIATTSYRDATISLWDATEGVLKRRLRPKIKIPEGGRIFNQVRFSPDGKTLACCGQSPLIHRLDPTTGRELPAIDTKDTAVDCILFTPDGKRLFSGGPSGIRLWDLTDKKSFVQVREVRRQPPWIGGNIAEMALSPNGDFLVYAYSEEADTTEWGKVTKQHLRVIDTVSGRQLCQIQRPIEGVWNEPGGYFNVVFGKDNDRFACISDGEGIQVREVNTGHCLRTIPDAVFPTVVPDSGLFLVGADKTDEQLLRLWDWHDGKERLRIHLDPLARTVESRRGWEDVPRRPLASELDSDEAAGAGMVDLIRVAFSSDGRVMATAGSWSPLEMWDLGTGKRLRRLTDSDQLICWVTFFPGWQDHCGSVQAR